MTQTRHSHSPHSSQSGYCLFSAPGECWLLALLRPDCRPCLNIQTLLSVGAKHLTKAFWVNFRFDKYIFQEQEEGVVGGFLMD